MIPLDGIEINWVHEDWIIAAKLGCTPRVARALRGGYDPKWENWNWMVEDSTIARDHNITRERAGQIRAELFGARGIIPV